MKTEMALARGTENRGQGVRTGKCCLYCGGFAIARNSMRTNYGWYRRYFCKDCGARFTLRTLSWQVAQAHRRQMRAVAKAKLAAAAKPSPPRPLATLETDPAIRKERRWLAEKIAQTTSPVLLRQMMERLTLLGGL